MAENKNKDKDQLTGIETTGHEWDGIQELNLPAPRWWLWVFFICCIWAFGYWIFYPAWPTLSGHTQGSKGWTSHKKLAEEQAEIVERRGEFAKQIKQKSLEEIQKDPELYAFALAGGKTMFKENCAACHGTGAEGRKGYPNLNDDDWIWGGKLNDIYHTLQVGVRSNHSDTRMSQMPAFGKDGILNKQQIEAVAAYVLDDQNVEGGLVFKENCAACHGDDGKGNREMGAPNLKDAIWLYGDNKEAIMQQVINPKHGVMPAWGTRLPDEVIKQLTIYVHSLGGGE